MLEIHFDRTGFSFTAGPSFALHHSECLLGVAHLLLESKELPKKTSPQQQLLW